jgi:hypothetical protein
MSQANLKSVIPDLNSDLGSEVVRYYENSKLL